ncbi:MAG: hypothetical protein Q8K68_09650 [Nitrospirota bacterium]|nr:hypothetical protein [Nitrospirota bacterium]
MQLRLILHQTFCAGIALLYDIRMGAGERQRSCIVTILFKTAFRRIDETDQFSLISASLRKRSSMFSDTTSSAMGMIATHTNI